jgi:hypothetical protein
MHPKVVFFTETSLIHLSLSLLPTLAACHKPDIAKGAAQALERVGGAAGLPVVDEVAGSQSPSGGV